MHRSSLFISLLARNICVSQAANEITGIVQNPVTITFETDEINVIEAEFMEMQSQNTNGGGAIALFNATTYILKVEKSYFYQCFSFGSNMPGGAILSEDVKQFTCTDSCYTQCFASKGHFNYINAQDGTISISQTSCVNCYDNARVGQMTNVLMSNGLTTYDCNYSSNLIGGYGAGIAVISYYNAVVQKCSFNGNLGNSILNLEGSTYKSLIEHNNIINNRGDSIISVNGNYKIDYSSFSNPEISTPVIIISGSLEINDCIFDQNYEFPSGVETDDISVGDPKIYKNLATEFKECHSSDGGAAANLVTPGPTPLTNNWIWSAQTVVLILIIILAIIACVFFILFVIITCFCKVPRVYKTIRNIESHTQERGLLEDPQEPITAPVATNDVENAQQPENPTTENITTPENNESPPSMKSPSRVQIILDYKDESETSSSKSKSKKSDEQKTPERTPIIKSPSDDEPSQVIQHIELPHDEEESSSSTITDPQTLVRRPSEAAPEDKPAKDKKKKNDDESDSYYSDVHLQVTPLPTQLAVSDNSSDNSTESNDEIPKKKESVSIPVDEEEEEEEANDKKKKRPVRRSYAGTSEDSTSSSSTTSNPKKEGEKPKNKKKDKTSSADNENEKKPKKI